MNAMDNKNNNRQNESNINSDIKELPIAAHIFEGHLYVKDDATNKWLWRLFRFDGTSLTCLSSKKIKLPPHTFLDVPSTTSLENRPVSLLTQSASASSFTSPLLATPKHKTDRIASSVSLDAKSTDSHHLVASYYQLPKWTVDMINISSISLLKPKQKKTKGLKLTVNPNRHRSKCFCIRTYDDACYVMRAQKQHDLERWIFVLAKMWKFAQAARQMFRPIVSPKLPLNTSYSATQFIGSGLVSRNNSVSNSQMMSPAQHSATAARDHTRDSLLKRPKYHNSTMLSEEKAMWIEEWIKSLEELETHTTTTTTTAAAAADIHIKPRKRVSSSARLSRQQLGYSIARKSIHVSSNDPLSSVIIPSNGEGARHSMARRPSSSFVHRSSGYMSYFQDANTVHTEETFNSKKEQKYPRVRYHNTVRAQSIKVIRNSTIEHAMITPFSATIISHKDLLSLQNKDSPLDVLEKMVEPPSAKRAPLSPPQTPEELQENDEDDVCLADIQKSLRGLEISKKKKSSNVKTNKHRNDHPNNWYRNSWASPIQNKSSTSNRLSTATFS